MSADHLDSPGLLGLVHYCCRPGAGRRQEAGFIGGRSQVAAGIMYVLYLADRGFVTGQYFSQMGTEKIENKDRDLKESVHLMIYIDYVVIAIVIIFCILKYLLALNTYMNVFVVVLNEQAH